MKIIYFCAFLSLTYALLLLYWLLMNMSQWIVPELNPILLPGCIDELSDLLLGEFALENVFVRGAPPLLHKGDLLGNRQIRRELDRVELGTQVFELKTKLPMKTFKISIK